MIEQLLSNLKYDSPAPPPGVEFLGEVPASGFINGEELASAIDLTAGIVLDSDAGWLKFVLDGKTLYVAKRNFRHTISWSSIHAVGAVFGTSMVVVQGDTYKVRLLKGVNIDPVVGYSGINNDPVISWGSEWNRLFYPIIPEPYAKPPSGVSGEGIIFGSQASYATSDLYSVGSDGGRIWCQETQEIIGSTDRKIYRNINSTMSVSLGSDDTHRFYGWRPVLELVE